VISVISYFGVNISLYCNFSGLVEAATL